MRTFVLILLLVSFPHMTFGAAEEPLEIAGASAVIYKRVDQTNLFLYIINPKGHQKSDKRPTAVFFFGGGWNGGTPTQFEHHCRHLADKGMVAM
ncbi:MAG: alpha/beta hydrolase, partial [Planctomycetaceae bacterium]|nr:alpha/beta hydrolase [Planctomycetaceae bacterium]